MSVDWVAGSAALLHLAVQCSAPLWFHRLSETGGGFGNTDPAPTFQAMVRCQRHAATCMAGISLMFADWTYMLYYVMFCWSAVSLGLMYSTAVAYESAVSPQQ
jgi:hypothetical protein